MAVFPGAFVFGMGVVVILRVGFEVVNVAFGVVLPLVEGALAAEELADDVVAAPLQHAGPLGDLLATRRHRRELFS
jgi:hypothetical protein